MINKVLAQQVIDDLIAHPEGYNVWDWDNCIAGRVGKLTNTSPYTAAKQLGLDDRDLFYCDEWPNYNPKDDDEVYNTTDQAIAAIKYFCELEDENG